MKMRAAIRKGFSGTMAFSDDYSKPAFSATKRSQKDHILVKIDAASLNPVDYKMGRGVLGPVVGLDFCGTVEEVGRDVSHLKVGDIVYGDCLGSMTEYSVTHSTRVAKYSPPTTATATATEDDATTLTSTWTCTELAALNVAYVSSLQCLKRGNIITDSSSTTDDDSHNNKEKSVLIIGASGGCGTAAIQLCKGVGVSRIVAICSSKNASMVQEMGATEVVDYTNETELKTFLKENVGQFDCVLDAATSSGGGENYWSLSVPLLKQNSVGQYVTLNGSTSKWFRKMMNMEKANQSLILVEPNTADLELIVQILNKINSRPFTKIMPFTEQGFLDGIQQLKSRRVKGKLVYPISQK